MAVLNLTTGVVFLKSGALNFSGILTTNVDGSAVTSADGLVLQNGTAATSGVQVQISPRIRLRGTAWDTAASSTEDWIIENLPVAGASPTDSIFRLARSVNSAANVTLLTLGSSTGIVTATGPGGVTGGFTMGSGGSLTFNSVGYITGGGATGLFLLRDLAATEGVGLDVTVDSVLTLRPRSFTGFASYNGLGYRINGGAGAATSSSKVVKNVTAIADATATAILTITVPNAGHAAVINLTLLGSIGAGGAIGAFEVSNVAEGRVVVTRTPGVASVAVAAALAITGTAAVAGATTETLAYSITNGAEGVGVTNTHTIKVTITRGGGTSTNHSCFVMAEVMNVVTAGITIA